jgi:uncharacterized peroxidase-related enzyme
MTFIRTVPVAEATGDVQALYESEREPSGYVPNYVKAFSVRPEIWSAFQQLLGTIRKNFDLRRYELVTVGAALAIKSSYCSLAHGQVLRDKVLSAGQTEAFARDFRLAELTPAEKVMVAFVQKVALQASTVTQEEVDELRSHGFSDVEIFDIASATTARCFLSKLLDGIGAEHDASYADIEPGLRQLLTVGRAIEKSPTT